MEPEKVKEAMPAAPSMTLEDARKAMVVLIANHDANAWQLGHLYNVIIDNKLTQQGPYARAEDFFQQFEPQMPLSTLRLYGAVNRVFPEHIARKYGVSRLGKLLTYVKVAHAEPPAGDPGPFKVKFVQEDGTLTEKPFGDCTRDEVANGIKYLRTPPASVPPEEARRITDIQGALTHRLGDHTHVTVKAHKVSGHETEIDLAHIPLSQLPEVLAALSSLLMAPGRPDGQVADVAGVA